jgi:Carboxypeptidase regulatory-like domain
MTRRLLWLVLAALAPVMLTAQGPDPVRPSPATDAQWPTAAPSPFLAPFFAPKRNATVLGQVVDTAGRGVSNAVVHLSSQGASQVRLTDGNGWFYFLGVPAGDAHITASRPGYLDGAWGRRRAGGDDLPLVFFDGQWVGTTIELFRPATISGLVVDEINEPLVGITVQAFRRVAVAGRTHLEPAGRDVTNDRGEYRLCDLVPGDYIVGAPSVAVTVPLATMEAVGTSGAVTLDVATLLTMNGGLGAVRSGAASGLLLDADGDHATLLGQTATPPAASRDRAFVYPSQYFPGTDLASIAMPITVGSGETRSGVVFQLHPVAAARVEGAVIGPDGPVAGQLLRLLPDGQDIAGLGSEAATTISAPDGSFVFTGVPPGRYAVDARSAASVLLATPAAQLEGTLLAGQGGTANPRRLDGALGGRRDIAVGEMGLRDVIVTLTRGVTINGRVVLDGTSPPPSAVAWQQAPIVVEPAGGDRSGVPNAVVDADGSFVTGGLQAGRFFVRLPATPPGWAVASIDYAGMDVSRVPLDTGLGMDTVDVVVTLTDRPTEVNGTVRDARGVPMPGAAVLAFPTRRGALLDYGAHPPELRRTRAASSGIFVLRGLPPGDYNLVAIDDADADNWQAPDRLDELARGAARISLERQQIQTKDLRVAAPRSGSGGWW